jgi:hypothetical protein
MVAMILGQRLCSDVNPNPYPGVIWKIGVILRGDVAKLRRMNASSSAYALCGGRLRETRLENTVINRTYANCCGAARGSSDD